MTVSEQIETLAKVEPEESLLPGEEGYEAEKIRLQQAKLSDVIKLYIQADELKKLLEGKVKAVKELLDFVESVAVPKMVEEGMTSIKTEKKLAYLSNKVAVSPAGDREDVIAGLKNAELGTFVSENYNTQTLTSYVAEIAREVELELKGTDEMYSEEAVLRKIPEALRPHIKIKFLKELRLRKA